jgi:hypothetical protein
MWRDQQEWRRNGADSPHAQYGQVLASRTFSEYISWAAMPFHASALLIRLENTALQRMQSWIGKRQESIKQIRWSRPSKQQNKEISSAI